MFSTVSVTEEPYLPKRFNACFTVAGVAGAGTATAAFRPGPGLGAGAGDPGTDLGRGLGAGTAGAFTGPGLGEMRGAGAFTRPGPGFGRSGPSGETVVVAMQSSSF
jgi:hypothetical protein